MSRRIPIWRIVASAGRLVGLRGGGRKIVQRALVEIRRKGGTPQDWLLRVLEEAEEAHNPAGLLVTRAKQVLAECGLAGTPHGDPKETKTHPAAKRGL